ncbi:ankyrin repeat domain-containing protein [Actinoplanes sichuanensis]|uniref:Ankyrin repeat domain-containing protein n=1 Tax=Actinoplanes sichuanensis TaxID=512349 RepID=A0ABW4AUF8_9ACTN|nr:ankyrin repeat domain-containing protein [Actinoplanes sichuanensis]
MILTEAAARGWSIVRRYAVPAPMIHRATERRLAGDWRGACDAADVAVDLDLSKTRYGTATTGRIEEDLRHLAPELLRWHLPRRPSTGHTALSPRRVSVLARYDDDLVLAVGSPRTGYGRQRLRLFLTSGQLPTSPPPDSSPGSHAREPCTWHQRMDPDRPRHLWDVRHTDELLTWYGLAPAPHDQLIWDLHDTDRFRQTWADLGVDIDEQHLQVNRRLVAGYWHRLPEIVHAVREAAATSSGRIAAGPNLAFTPTGDGRLAMDFRDYPRHTAYVALDRLGLPLDAVLISLGLLDPDHLHPLIHSVLFPSAAGPPAGPPRPVASAAEPVRVRCGGVWHEVRRQGGRVLIPHTEREEQRETTLVALGGSRSGCFAVKTAMENGPAGLLPPPRHRIVFEDPWAVPPVKVIVPSPPAARPARLPRRLREQRRELMRLALHGDTEGVVSLLDAGVSAHVRDHRGRTLLHFMAHLRDLTLLERLLAEGLDVDAPDVAGVTPLVAAAYGMGDVEVIRALITAGARMDALVERTHEPITAWLETARPDVFAAISDLEDTAAVTARLDWRHRLQECARKEAERRSRNP